MLSVDLAARCWFGVSSPVCVSPSLLEGVSASLVATAIVALLAFGPRVVGCWVGTIRTRRQHLIELDRVGTGSCPMFTALDPVTLLGVRPSDLTSRTDDRLLPDYVPREIDPDIDVALRLASSGGQRLVVVAGPPKSGPTAPAVGGYGVQGRTGPRPPRSSMIMVMKAAGLWKPLALRRMRPMTELLASAMPLVKPHSMVASIESR